MTRKLQLKCALAFLGICVFWGTSNLVTKIGVEAADSSICKFAVFGGRAYFSNIFCIKERAFPC